MFQKVTLIGNLGSDPETRATQTGQTVCSFSVATNRKWTNGDGTPGEETVWWRVSAWGKLGEICQQYLSKGRQVFLEGEMVADRETGGPKLWTDNNGETKASFELRASTMKMIGGRNDADETASAAPSNTQRAQPAQRAQAQQRQQPQRMAQRTPANTPADYQEADPIPF